ncbi:MAG: acyl carrier protein [Clostridia bacterium]|nr:acyl carrier protein [Clostridia bacterium]
MLETVRKIIYQVTGKKNITLETDFIKDLELNSFDIMNMVCAFEDHYNMSVPTRDVWQMHQVKDVIDYMIGLGLAE